MTEHHQTRRLLAVDDDVSSAELIVRVAERSGFEAFATSESRGVIGLATALQPKVIVVDICMPNVDAIELFDLLIEARYKGRIIIASGQDEVVLASTLKLAQSKGLNATNYVQKPIDLQGLRALLVEQSYAAAS